MPKLKVKTEYIEKLKALGVYEKWLSNVKIQWDTEDCWLRERKTKIDFFSDLINYSFRYQDTPEGQTFWYTISES